MRDDINNEIKNELQKTLEAGISDEIAKKTREQLERLMTEAEEDLTYRITDNLAHNLVAYVADMASRTVKALLDGNEDEMRRYLGCERGHWTGRSDGDQWGRKREIDEWHPVIHGTLFETGGVKLRRDIVAAHRDLITDERVKDLEDQVASLVAQLNKADERFDRFRQEYSC